ncbi:MAG: hypothetical protein ACHQT9_01385 [Candidatus Saccharimonadales bacterium]
MSKNNKPHESRADEASSEVRNARPSKKIKIFGLLFLLILVVIGTTSLYKKHNTVNQFKIPTSNIVIGSTTITPSEIRSLSSQLSSYGKSLKTSFGSNLDETATRDLILNAALIDQAHKLGVNISQDEYNSVLSQYTPVDTSSANYKNYVNSNHIALATKILNDNRVYESILNDKLIKSKNLFIVGINYDSPYFNQSKNPSYLRSEAVKILKDQYLPLFQKGESPDQIASQVTLNYTLPNKPQYNIDIFFKSAPTYAYNQTNCTDAAPCFNDAQVGKFASIPGIVSAQSQVDSLNKVGQHTGVFISKAGFIGIMQLTSQTSGSYKSWDDMTNSYTKKYVASLETHPNFGLYVLSSVINYSKVLGLDVLRGLGSLVIPVQAAALSCSSHDITVYVHAHFIDDTTGVVTAAPGAWVQESRGDSICPTSGGYYVDDSGQSGHRPNRFTTDGSGNASQADNCFTPDPYLLQRAPSTLPSGAYYDANPVDGQKLDHATVYSGSTSYTVNSGAEFGNQFGPAAENRPGSYIDNLWGGGIINANGGMTIELYYKIHRTTHTPPTPNGSADVRCNDVTVEPPSPALYDNSSAGTALVLLIYDTGRDNGNGTPTSPGANLQDDYLPSSTTFPWTSSQLVPYGSNVYAKLYLKTHDKVHNTITYSLLSTTSSAACYSADCQINSVTGDLPGGLIGSDGKISVNATIYSDSPSGLDLPGNDSIAAHVLNLEDAGGGVNGALSGITNTATGLPYAGPISYNGTVNENFNATISGDGNIQIEANYVGSSYITTVPPGSSCSFPVTEYIGPTISVTGGPTCDGNLSVHVSDTDPDVPQPFPYSIYVIVDGSARYGNFTADSSGNYSWTIPSNYFDGANHNFAAYVVDPLGVQDGGPANGTMIGCEAFHIDPGANGAHLMPNPESPTSFGSLGNDASITVTYSYPGFSSSVYGPSSSPNPGFIGVPANATYSYTKNGAAIGPSGTVGTGRYINTNVPTPIIPVPVITAGDKYCLIVGVTPSDGYVQNDGTIIPGTASTTPNPDQKKSCDTVVNRPYYKVYNNGAIGGANFPSSVPSIGSVETSPILAGFNVNKFLGQQYDYGSGSELSNIATCYNASCPNSDGGIFGLASTQQGSKDTRRAYDTNFANITANGTYVQQELPKFGGKFGGSISLSDQEPTTPTVDWTTYGSQSSPASGSYVVGTNTTRTPTILNSMTINPGNDVSLFVNGDVFINGDITFGGAYGGWGITSNTITTPSFVLKASGNIYIANGVGELDGAYEAAPDGIGPVHHGGTIYTCGVEVSPTQFAPEATTSMYYNCNKQLTVVGSFSAYSVHLMRSYGSVRDEQPVGSPLSPPALHCDNNGGTTSPRPTCAAEVFDFSPEYFLSYPNTTGGTGGAINAINVYDLPPVL